jgi:hypothetical protein
MTNPFAGLREMLDDMTRAKEPPDFPMPSTPYGERLTTKSMWLGRGEHYEPYDPAVKLLPEDVLGVASGTWPGRDTYNFTFRYSATSTVTLDMRRVSLAVPPEVASRTASESWGDSDPELLKLLKAEWSKVGGKTPILRVDLHFIPPDKTLCHHAIVTYLNGFSVEKESL